MVLGIEGNTLVIFECIKKERWSLGIPFYSKDLLRMSLKCRDFQLTITSCVMGIKTRQKTKSTTTCYQNTTHSKQTTRDTRNSYNILEHETETQLSVEILKRNFLTT